MAKQAPLSDKALGHVARRFAVLAEPMRLRLLQALFAGEMNVNALVAATGGTQANVSRHLSYLAQHGLVERESRGVSVFYRVSDPSIYALCDLVCGNIARRYEQASSDRAVFTPT